MSASLLRMAGVIFVVLPTVMFGGVTLLRHLQGRAPGYMDNPTRRALWTAGHAHAGVLLVLALVGFVYVDQANLAEGLKSFVRVCLVAPPILMPLGFFLSIASPKATKPNGLIALTYVGGLVLAAGTLTLGVGLLR